MEGGRGETQHELDAPCAAELAQDFGDPGAHIRLDHDDLPMNGYWNGYFQEGDVSLAYEIVRGDGSCYQRTAGHKGHVLLRERRVVAFGSYRMGPGPIDDIRNDNARTKAEHIARNIERIVEAGFEL